MSADQNKAIVRRFIEEDLVSESGYRNSYSIADAGGWLHG